MNKNEAYEVGYEDFFKNNHRCAYKPKSRFYKEWQRGFNDAYFYNRKTYVQSIPAERLQQV